MNKFKKQFYIFTVLFCILSTAEAKPITTHTETVYRFTNTSTASGDITSTRFFHRNIGSDWLINIRFDETDATNDDLVITGTAQHRNAPHQEPLGPVFNFHYDLDIDRLDMPNGTTRTFHGDTHHEIAAHSINGNVHKDVFKSTLVYDVTDRGYFTGDDDIVSYTLIVTGLHDMEPGDPFVPPITTRVPVPAPSTPLLIAIGLVLLIISRKTLRTL